VIILGIDPGVASTGWGIVKKEKSLKCLDYSVIRTQPGTEPGERLRLISNELSRVMERYQPDVLAIEKIYFFKNLKTAIPVSQAKGAILLTAARKKIPVWEYTPLQVKLIIAGHGRADKKQVQESLKKMLKLKEAPKPDHAADALAVAATYLLKEI